MTKFHRSDSGLFVPEDRRMLRARGPRQPLGMSAQHQALLMPDFRGPLDGWETNLKTAMSFSRLLTSWAGSCLQARRSSDSTLLTIGFTGSRQYFNVAALNTFTGANDGFLETFINQQGTAGDGYDQPSNGAQPRLSTAGVFYGQAYFDGTNDVIQSQVLGSTGSYPAYTVFLRGTLRSSAGTQVLFEKGTDLNSFNSLRAYTNVTTGLHLEIHDTTPGGYSSSSYSGEYPSANVQAWRYDRSQPTYAQQVTLFKNGVAQSRTANSDAPVLPDGNFGTEAFYLGGRATLYANLDLHTFLVYHAALSNADCTAISAIIAALP